MNVEIVLLSIGFVLGVIITLYFIGKRPVYVNLNADARAQANGRSPHVSVPNSSDNDSRGSIADDFLSGIARLIRLHLSA